MGGLSSDLKRGRSPLARAKTPKTTARSRSGLHTVDYLRKMRVNSVEDEEGEHDEFYIPSSVRVGSIIKGLLQENKQLKEAMAKLEEYNFIALQTLSDEKDA